MTVTTAGDPVAGPRIPFTLGTETRHAVYASGNGTRALAFHYTVAEGDADADGIEVAANALALNGGTIVDSGTATRRRSPTRRSRRSPGTRWKRCARSGRERVGQRRDADGDVRRDARCGGAASRTTPSR